MEDNKGFTLIELIATIIILAVVMSIGAYAITNIIKQSKEKNYAFLIKNIRDGAEVYYQECTYSNNSGIECPADWKISLGDLVKYGYIKENTTDKNGSGGLINPLDDSDITDCIIKIEYNNGIIEVTNQSTNKANCPKSYDLNDLDNNSSSSKSSTYHSWSVSGSRFSSASSESAGKSDIVIPSKSEMSASSSGIEIVKPSSSSNDVTY